MNEREERAVDAVKKFLDANYPCDCPPNDPNCPANTYEAYEIILLLQKCGVKF